MELAATRPTRPLIWPSCINAIRSALAARDEIYLVGGAVRDAYLHRPLHDVDLAVPGDGQPLARQIANTFKGAYYPLDRARGVGRAIIPWKNEQIIVDVAQFRGPDLLSDLQARDFTLNALAVDLTGDLQAVFDPTGGLADLATKQLRQCGPNSIADDPIRILRAVRASLRFGLGIEPETRANLKRYAAQLTDASIERIRDEFMQILGGTRPAAALSVLQQLGVLSHIIPETQSLIGVLQSAPHQFDVWHHTLTTIEHLDAILHLFAPQRSDDAAARIQTGTIAFSLSHIRAELQDHLARQWPNERTHRSIVMLAALLHDIGKPATTQTNEKGRIQFLRHEQIGAEIAQNRAEALRLSRDEARYLTTIVEQHMRPHWLHGQSLSARAIYRFWRATGAAGVDVCLLALADYLGTYGVTLDTQAWIDYVTTIQTLLDRYYTRHDTLINPPQLINGQTLLEDFGLPPGPQIGEILENVREAQASGEITTTEEALDWVQRFLD